jgi:hypothetical protein
MRELKARRFVRNHSLLRLAAAAGAVVATTAIIGVPGAGAQTPTPASFSFTVSTGLLPHGFSSSISDYVTRCQAGSPLQVHVSVPAGHEGRVDRTGSNSSFTAPETLQYGQGFSVSDINLATGTGATYYVRCLPPDFPNFTATRNGNPAAAFYLVAPQATTPGPQRYVAMFDDNGTPVWWLPVNGSFGDFTLLPDGDVAVIPNAPPRPIQEYKLTGPLVRQISANGHPGVDLHEVQMLPDGSYLFAVTVMRSADESFMTCGNQTGSANAQVEDEILFEAKPDGTIGWSWDTLDHIPVTATDPGFYCTVLANSPPNGPGYDNFHFNSAADDGAGSDDPNGQVLVSYRHLSSVILINKGTGNIIWKLGGPAVNGVQSLSFVNDTYGNFSGQHDARFYFANNGTQITLHDDGTEANRPPRAVRYSIDTANHTATMVEQVNDNLVTSAACCGSARKMQPSGDWVMSWGFSPVVTEFTPNGAQRLYLLQWTDPGVFSYRAEPVARGELSINQLRADMNTQFPRP